MNSSSGEDLQKRKKDAIRYAKWMQKKGILFPEDAKRKIKALIVETGWVDDGAQSLTTLSYGEALWVETKEDHNALLDIPPDQMIPRAKEIMRSNRNFAVEEKPFDGLVEKHPRKALAALVACPSDEEQLHCFWDALFRKWPESHDDAELYREINIRIQQLSHELIRKINYGISAWIRKHFENIRKASEKTAWKMVDHVVEGLISNDGSATKSGIGPTYTDAGGVHQETTFDKALNSPIGEITQSFLNALEASSQRQTGIPEAFKGRIEKLLKSPGDGSKHAISIAFLRLNEIYAIDPNWVERRLIPELDFEKPAAHVAWSSYLLACGCLLKEAGAPHASKLFSSLKPRLLALIAAPHAQNLEGPSEQIIAKITVLLCIHRENQASGFTKDETRSILRLVSDSGRREAIACLKKSGNQSPGCWAREVVPFINEVWPRESRYKAAIVPSWIDLLSSTDGAFPEVYGALRPFLVPLRQGSLQLNFFLRKALRENEKERLPISDYPDAALDFLDKVVPDDMKDIPSELARVLELIRESDENLANELSFIRLSELTRK